MSGSPPKRRLRPTSRNVGQSRIRNLKCFKEVYDRIIEGWPIAEVAKFIQEVKKESTDITMGTLIAELQDFRSKIPPAELTAKRIITPAFIKAKQAVEEGIDELAELERLYKMQMGRIELNLAAEKKLKVMLPATGAEVKIAKDILTSYAELKMDLGLSKRHIGQMQIDTRLMADVAVRYQKTEVQEVLNNPQSRKKLLNLAERLLARSTDSEEVPRSPSPEIIEMEAEPVTEDSEEFESEEVLPEEGSELPI